MERQIERFHFIQPENKPVHLLSVVVGGYDPVRSIVAKITDFGLSMMKAESETSASTLGEVVQNIGTPRYVL